jgi:ribosomal-protein-alanine N-acetyltransferase
MRYWSSEPYRTIDESERWLAAMIAAPSEESADFIVEHDGRVIGKAGLWKAPEIGFILHPEAWGRGFAGEALRAVIPHAFVRFSVPALIADVDPRNSASLGLLDKLGFAVTGRAERTYEVGGQWCDSVYLTLYREAWTKGQGGR